MYVKFIDTYKHSLNIVISICITKSTVLVQVVEAFNTNA